MKVVGVLLVVACISTSFAFPDVYEKKNEAKLEGIIWFMMIADSAEWHSLLFAGISVPNGLRSITDSTKLLLTITNNRAQAVKVFWVDYSGNAKLYSTLQPNDYYRLNTYGTHPWFVTDTYDTVITYFVPYTSNMEVTIEWVRYSNKLYTLAVFFVVFFRNEASWWNLCGKSCTDWEKY